MDFLKACTTNVYAVEDVARTPYHIYSWSSGYSDDVETWRKTQTILATIRSDGTLCSHVGDHIYIFGPLSEHHQGIMSTNSPELALSNKGTLETPRPQNDSDLDLRQVLLDAIEHSLAFILANDPAMVHIGKWTWLFYNTNEEDGSVLDSSLITLYTKFTTTGGLYLISDFAHASCIPMYLVDPEADSDIIIAPYGHPAKTPPGMSNKPALSGAVWESRVTQALQSQGINIPGDMPWILIEPTAASDGITCEWPAHLCFKDHNDSLALDYTHYGDRDWRRWFISTEEGAIFRNPLAMAEEWFKCATDREKAAKVDNCNVTTSSQGERTAQMGSTTDVAMAESNLTTSPPFNQRVLDQQAAMSGIYPTPPDGFAPGQLGMQLGVATPSVTQADQSAACGDLVPTSDDMQFSLPQHQPSVGPESFQLDDHDMLFGDENEMEFGENAIGDADFSFFDEPDDEPTAPAQNADMQTALALEQDNNGELGSVGKENAADVIATNSTPAPVKHMPQQEELHSETTAIDLLSEQNDHLAPICEPQFDERNAEPEKPLSPFGIRERLLPPPVPASVAQNDPRMNAEKRRSSTFAPINFRDGLNLSSKYAGVNVSGSPRTTQAAASWDISLPSSRKKHRKSNYGVESDADFDSESESGNSYEPSSSEADEAELPPRLPWESRKRKRHLELDGVHPLTGSLERLWSDDDAEDEPLDSIAHGMALEVLTKFMRWSNRIAHVGSLLQPKDPPSRIDPPPETAIQSDSTEALSTMPQSVEKSYSFRKEDLIYIAQIAHEQSVSAIRPASPCALPTEELGNRPMANVSNFVRRIVENAIEVVLPAAEGCDLGKIALTREPLRSLTNPGKAPQGQPRVPQRSDSAMMGPEYFALPAPYIRIRRGKDNWEMLPSCLSFWEPLGLGPASGLKNVRAFCVFPFNEDLQHLVESFMADLGTAYESCKLGSHVHLRNVSETDEQDNFEDGMAPVELSEDASLDGALKSYAATCADLGRALANIAHQENDRAIVVYMLNPFSGRQAEQHLCACFWILFKAYRDNVPKSQRNQCSSDIFLQLLPINMVASYDAFVVADAKRMATLAREVYDRCPPSSHAQYSDGASALPIPAAPAVELASAPPKRIGFQLASEPPTDLLYEGSILHLAFACSLDGQWLTASWMDNTGKNQSSSSFCLRGRSFAEVAQDVWDCTMDILSARKVLWRVFVVAAEIVESSILQCWRMLCIKPRAQPLCVTMMSVNTTPALHLSAPGAMTEAQYSGNGDAGFLTPASTPQGPTFTSSPDVSGHGGNAPPTPAPSDTASSLMEHDPDAHLMDLADETWAVLYSPKLSNIASNTGLAHGALFRRGNTELVDSDGSAGGQLSSLGVNLHWTIQVKPQGGVDEGSVKQAELTLREVLRMYRNLALLTKARGLDYGKASFLPIHVALAVRGVEGLEGMLEQEDDT